ncbi:aldehyde dehydrogenase (NADP(+)) [Candidatus Aminicenantes bacterium AC-334-K16]|jgi:NADP-dependent aldehyde dehydrogenase|nr:aldehyde dehydrogenase (NADP(+)) [Candidatus Aminicenantes bacterium AC-334-K16]
MNLQPVFIAGKWRTSHYLDTFQATNPRTGEKLPDLFPVSSWEELKEALDHAYQAVPLLASLPPEAIADFLETMASKIEAKKEIITSAAALETGLPQQPRLLEVELPRTIDQLRQTATAVRERSWCQATIDTQRNIRAKYGPLGGVVIVIGPNNFPLAFNAVSGGDFAAALAAGNPVLAKAHPLHPKTSQLLAQAMAVALEESQLPPPAIQFIYHFRPEDGFKAISHPATAAVAFTGSRTTGLAIKEVAEKSGKLAYLEMSSINPVFLLPRALQERGARIAEEFSSSCLLGNGQFCTNPGFIVLTEGPGKEEFLQRAVDLFQNQDPGCLLGQQIQFNLEKTIQKIIKEGAILLCGGQHLPGPGYRFEPTLLQLESQLYLQKPAVFQTEMFGPVSLLVICQNQEEMLQIATSLEGNLTASLYTHSQGEDDAFYRQLEPLLRLKAGRLLNDKMPTGVAVSPAMMHGGPYPATGHPGFTSVGIPGAILRFAARHGYDNVPQDRLPPELQDENPTGRMWRFIDSRWTQASITRD